MAPNCDYYDQQALARAQHVAAGAIDAFLEAGPNEAVIVAAPAGAGKTQFVVDSVGAVRKRRRQFRIAAGTPTNEQAFALVRRLAEAYPRETITLVPASTVTVPTAVTVLPNVQQAKAADANQAAVIVGTLNKLGDAFSRGDLLAVDRLLVDESYQADSSRYFGVAGLAPTHLLVGDSGQLSPFSPVADADYWRGLPEDPLQTAVGVLLRNHPSTAVHKLPISRRLDARAVPVAQAFYSDLPFEAAVLPGVRELRLVPAIATSRRVKLADHVLDRAAVDGWVHLEMPAAPVLTADPEIVDVICELVARLAQRRPRVRCELTPNWTELAPRRIAVGVSHNDQKDILRSRLSAIGHPGVIVDTANKLQGLEFDFVIAWHPLAGLPEPDEFHLEPGRLCVLLTRHRHACVVIGRASDRTLLDAIPPATPAYLGWDPDPLSDGWGVHEAVFRALEAHRAAA